MSRSVSLAHSLRAQWHWAAVGCVAAGATAVLLLPGAAQVGPAIVPADDAPAKAAAVKNPEALTDLAGLADMPMGTMPISTTAARPVQAAQPTISIELNGIPVAEAIMMIAGQGEVNITIGVDVDTKMVIPYTKMTDVTPQEAIKRIAQAASLRWKKLDDKSYFVGKVLPDGFDEAQPASSKAGIWTPIRSENSTFGTTSNAARLYEDGNGSKVLPALGSSGSGSDPYDPTSLFQGNTVSNRRNVQEQSEVRPIRVRNVRAGILAWWIDPKHQEQPTEYAIARAKMNDILSPHMLKSAVDPAVLQQIKGTSPALPFATGYTPYANPYSNPYANPYGAWTQPQYRTNYQFGGFGGGGGNNNNNRFGGNNNNGGGFGGQGGGVLELPEGIDQLVAIDAQNVLLVYGTAEGIAALQNIIEYLDRPIRQVEIEAQFVDVSVSEARAFGIQFFNRTQLEKSQQDNTDNGNNNNNTNQNQSAGGIGAGIPGANQLVVSYKNYQAQINFLTSSGRARIINSPRITTMNNLSANWQSQQITPIILTSSTEGIGGQTAESQNAFFLTTSIGIQVTPTINNDDTITVFLTPFVQTQVPTPSLIQGDTGNNTGDDDNNNNNNNNSAPSIPTVLAQSLTTVANVKDNDVIVLGGLRTRTESVVRSRIPILSRLPLIGKIFRSTNRTDVDRELIIFLTARILRRTDDVTPIQGP
jgi:type II secretory pathway component GspD/PulD (secretin)